MPSRLEIKGIDNLAENLKDVFREVLHEVAEQARGALPGLAENEAAAMGAEVAGDPKVTSTSSSQDAKVEVRVEIVQKRGGGDSGDDDTIPVMRDGDRLTVAGSSGGLSEALMGMVMGVLDEVDEKTAPREKA